MRLRKTLSLFLVLFMLLSMTPSMALTSGAAQDEVTYSDTAAKDVSDAARRIEIDGPVDAVGGEVTAADIDVGLIKEPDVGLIPALTVDTAEAPSAEEPGSAASLNSRADRLVTKSSGKRSAGTAELNATGDPCTLNLFITPTRSAGIIAAYPPAPYYVGQRITLVATPNSGYQFMWWVNYETDEFSYDRQYSTVLTESYCEWDAVFIRDGEYFVYVNRPLEMVVLPEADSYAPGAEVTLVAPPEDGRSIAYEIGRDVDGLADSVTWERIGSDGKFTMPAYHTWTRALYSVNVNVSCGPHGSASLSPDGPYFEGDEVTLTIHPDPGYYASHITGVPEGWTSSGNVITFPSDYDADINVEFAPIPGAEVTFGMFPSGKGSLNHSLNEETGEVTAEVVPSENYTLLYWVDYDQSTGTSQVLGTTNPFVFVPQKDTLLVAVLGFVYPSTDAGEVRTVLEDNGDVTLTASPAPGYSFLWWQWQDGTNSDILSRDASYTTPPRTDILVIAAFQQGTRRIFTYDYQPTRGSFSIVSPQVMYTAGQTVELHAEPAEGYGLDTFLIAEYVEGQTTYNMEPISGNSFVMPDHDVVVTASFSPVYTVTATASPEAGGFAIGGGQYSENDTVQMIALPNEGYRFLNWTENGTVVSSSEEYNFYARADRDLVANFKETDGTRYTISAGVDPTNGGTVTGAGSYEEGSTVTLTATPKNGYRFVNWTENGEVVSTETTYSFTAEGDRSLTANFELIPTSRCTISAAAEPAKGGTVSGAGTYEQGATVTLTAAPKRGYSFVNWTENGEEVCAEATYSFTAEGDRSLTANFSKDPVQENSYLDPTDPANPVKECTDYTELVDQTALETGWYVLKADATIESRITVTGDVNLILCDGATLNATSGINVGENESLTIWAQSYDENVAGKLIATGNDIYGNKVSGRAGIGGGSKETCGTVTINGGVITANGYSWAAGIGGGGGSGDSGTTSNGGNGGTVTINEGTVFANGGHRAPGIGGANGSAGGKVTITGGTVTASGYDTEAIGHGQHNSNSGELVISDGLGVYNSSEATEPVLYADREGACRGGWVKIESCDPHRNSNGHCAWCNLITADLGGEGTEDNPYEIATVDDWNELVRFTSEGDTSGKYFVQTADIAGVTTMIGSEAKPFKGVYIGGGHTLSVNITGEGEQRYCAPFSFITDASISGLVIDGSVTGHQHAAGLVGAMKGENTVTDVLVKAEIDLTGQYGGGVIGHGLDSTAILEGVAFTGTVTGGDNVGGIWGWSDSATVTMINCFECGTYTGGGVNPMGLGDTAGRTFTNVIHTSGLKGSPARNWGNAGDVGYSVTGGTDVEVNVDPGPYTFKYETSTIELHDGAMVCDGHFAAKAGATVSLTAEYVGTDPGFGGLRASDGTLTGDGPYYTIVMPSANVIIYAPTLEGIPYVDAAGEAQTPAMTESVTSETRSFNAGWYAVTEDVTVDRRIMTNGSVNLILCDGATLTASKGIGVPAGTSLTIWRQEEGTGSLTCGGGSDNYAAGIGGTGYGGATGDITINGGVINVSSGDGCGAGIGAAGYTGQPGTVTINAGTVTADGNHGGAAIGSGYYADGGIINITGGNITAQGGYASVGIGGGRGRTCGEINISGDDTVINAHGGKHAAGIGSGYNGKGGKITISGGTITASSGDGDWQSSGGAGIGGGDYSDPMDITITGGVIKSTGDCDGAAIGGGRGAHAGNIKISGGDITAQSSGCAAAIGSGGYRTNGGTIEITGGKIRAYGDRGGAIGGDDRSGEYSGGHMTIIISGGEVYAEGDFNGSAIGSGENATSNATFDITISGDAVVTAVGHGGAAAIGGGAYSAGLNVNIEGGLVTASVDRDSGAEAIGHGSGNGNSGNLTLSDESVVFSSPEAAEPVTGDGRYAVCRSSWAKITSDQMAVPYVDENGELRSVTNYSVLMGNDPVLNEKWYVSRGETTYTDRIKVDGDVKLILTDGSTLKAESGITVPGERALRIYGQSTLYTVPGTDEQTQGTGALIATTPATGEYHQFSAIGGERDDYTGDIFIHGGVITARGQWGAGIGGGDVGKSSGSLTVSNGCVEATGKYGSAGIGGGGYTNGSNVLITGGYVVAKGSVYEATDQATPGIGSGRPRVNGSEPRNSGWIDIFGGTVIAEAGVPLADGVGAQAIGVNLADAEQNGSIYLGLGDMKVFDSESAEEPVPTDRRGDATRGVWVKITECDHRYGAYDDWDADHVGTCDWCHHQTGGEPHEYGEPVYVWSEGHRACTATHTCLKCGHEESEEGQIAAAVSPGPLCEQESRSIYRATFENPAFETQTEEIIIPALGHSWSEWEVTTEPKCTEPGVETRTCANCGNEETRPVDALGHSWGEWETTTPATCSEPGVETRVCSRCGETETRQIEALDHVWGTPKYEWNADNSKITATAVCENDASHVTTETVGTNFVLLMPSTYESPGVGYYQADFENALFTRQRKDVVVPAVACKGGDLCPSKNFTDMPPLTSFAHIPIDWAVLNRVTLGTSATKFSPNSSCTRAQFVTFLWRVKGQPEPTSENNPFKDVKESGFYYKAMLWAVENGVTKGTSSTTFSPNAPVTRAQVVTFLYRFEGAAKPTGVKNPFKDVKKGAFYFDAVLWAVENKITSGVTINSFDPNGNCTRSQCVTFLYREFAK